MQMSTDPKAEYAMMAETPQASEADDGARMDRAVRDGFADAIRLHREADLPMAIWENEQVRLVSPFDIPLSDDSSPGVEDDA
jgi:hypothetical protein